MLQPELPQEPLAAGACCGARLRWMGWQPRSLLYWGVVVQLAGACAFQVACYSGLPGVVEGWAERYHTSHYQQEVLWLFVPSVLGSLGFIFGSYVSVVEVPPPADPRTASPRAKAPSLLSALRSSFAWLRASIGR